MIWIDPVEPELDARDLDDQGRVTGEIIDAAELSHLRAIAAAARRYVALLDAHRDAQAQSTLASNASPRPTAPSHGAILDARQALRRAVRGDR